MTITTRRLVQIAAWGGLIVSGTGFYLQQTLVDKIREMEMFVGTSKEKFFYHNTLLCLVKALEGKNITVDLRNDAYVCGELSSVDGYMNISFTNSVYCDSQGNEFSFENLFVHARNIRYVHVPETMPIITLMKNELVKSKKPPPDKKPIETSRKVKKAVKRHLDIVASLGK